MTTRSTRREFFRSSAGALAGVAFVGCGPLAARPARAQGRHREVVVNGRRIKTVDVHAHCAMPEAMALMNLKLGGPSLRPDLDMATAVSERLRIMDEQGIDVEALSINPYWYKADRELAKQIVASVFNSPIGTEATVRDCPAPPLGLLTRDLVRRVGMSQS